METSPPAPEATPGSAPEASPDVSSRQRPAATTGGVTSAGGADLVFEALSDRTRRQMLQYIADEGSATATELAEHLSLSRQAVAKHFDLLAGAGLIAGKRLGREHRYWLEPAPLIEAMAWMAAIGAEWDQRLLALREFLETRARARP